MLKLLETDGVTVTTIMDNNVDLLIAGNEITERFHLSSSHTLPIAEHGFSALIQVRCGNKEETVLLDTGVSPSGILYNMKTMAINLSDLQTIILSHGHYDHTNGLPLLLKQLDGKRIALIFHPDACLERKIVMPNGEERNISPPKIEDLRQENITYIDRSTPTLLADDTILVSGEIDRVTDFEKGFPLHYTKRENSWVNDPLIKDDQCVIINVREKGLVIVTGCSHAGIINTMLFAQALTGIKKIYAVMGGFHLTGGVFESIIPATVTELQKLSPRYLIPGHCTGFSAINQIANTLPEAFIASNVGTIFKF